MQASLRARASGLALKWLLRPRLDPRHSPEAQRRAVELFARLQFGPRHIDEESRELGGRPVLRQQGRQSDGSRALLYFHGGGYCVGSPKAWRTLTGHLSRAAVCPVYSLDYRLAPEHPYPAAVDDACAAFAELSRDLAPSSIAVAGDSAGAGLALALCLRLQAEDRPQPGALALFCPFTDLTLSGESMQRNRRHEPLLTRDWLEICGEYYAAETPREDPGLSPLFADLSGLPPMLIQAAAHDVLLDDARRLQAAARDAGVDSKLEIFADLTHDFQTLAQIVPEAQRALAQAGAYLKLRQQSGTVTSGADDAAGAAG